MPIHKLYKMKRLKNVSFQIFKGKHDTCVYFLYR